MTEYSADFEAVWGVYPKRNGKKVGKKPALTQWARLGSVDKAAAKADIEKRNRQGGWGKYIRDMQRYLRDRGWDDEWEPERRSYHPQDIELPEEPARNFSHFHRAMSGLMLKWIQRRAAIGKTFSDKFFQDAGRELRKVEKEMLTVYKEEQQKGEVSRETLEQLMQTARNMVGDRWKDLPSFQDNPPKPSFRP